MTFPVLVLERYGDRPQVLGWIFGGFGVGQVVGAVLSYRVIGRVDRLLLATAAGIGQTAVLWLLLPELPWPLLAATAAMTGAFFPFLNSVVITTRTMRTPPHLRPTVHTAAVTVALMLAPIGALAAGPALSAFGLDPVLAAVLAANTVFGDRLRVGGAAGAQSWRARRRAGLDLLRELLALPVQRHERRLQEVVRRAGGERPREQPAEARRHDLRAAEACRDPDADAARARDELADRAAGAFARRRRSSPSQASPSTNGSRTKLVTLSCEIVRDALNVAAASVAKSSAVSSRGSRPSARASADDAVRPPTNVAAIAAYDEYGGRSSADESRDLLPRGSRCHTSTPLSPTTWAGYQERWRARSRGPSSSAIRGAWFSAKRSSSAARSASAGVAAAAPQLRVKGGARR